MKITMNNVEALLDAMGDVENALQNIVCPLEEWRDLDGETDADSREKRRDAREEIDSNMDELITAIMDTCQALKIKTN